MATQDRTEVDRTEVEDVIAELAARAAPVFDHVLTSRHAALPALAPGERVLVLLGDEAETGRPGREGREGTPEVRVGVAGLTCVDEGSDLATEIAARQGAARTGLLDAVQRWRDELLGVQAEGAERLPWSHVRRLRALEPRLTRPDASALCAGVRTQIGARLRP